MSEKKTVRVPRRPAARVQEVGPSLTSGDVALRAYELFLQRGCEHGHDWEDWLTAERELTALATAAAHTNNDTIALRPAPERRRRSSPK